MIEQILENLGMSQRESKIYLAGLEAGLAPASKIATMAEQKRITCHQVLQQMKQKGRLTEVKKNNIAQYEMLSPQQLSTMYEKRVQKLKEKIPEMVGLMNQYASKPKVKYYEGREQVKDVILGLIDTGYTLPEGEVFFTFLGVSDIDPELAAWLQSDEFLAKRLACPAKTRSLMSPVVHPYNEYTKQYHEFRIVSDPVFDLANEIILYGGNKIALLMYNTDELSAIEIESVSFYRALKAIFMTLWNSIEGE